MKGVQNKGENKKRKRDDSQEQFAESPKKAKVHAQRKFAQGAAFNSSVITPIKDKVRPTASTQSSGPMLTSKCPNTEDFLTFLCFRRTSILPPKLDFFKEAVGSDSDMITNSNQKLKSEKATGNLGSARKKHCKNNEKTEGKKKVQPASVQALRKKYQEQRLAKQKVSNVTKLAQKVKGKNMVRTRSSAVIEEPKRVFKKRISGKENKESSTALRSGLKRSQISKPTKKVIKQKHLRMGLRSSGPTNKLPEKPAVLGKPMVVIKKMDNENETKKQSDIVLEAKSKNIKLKKGEGFSDFSSDENEPLLTIKKPKITPKKSSKNQNEEKEGRKSSGNAKTPVNDAVTAKPCGRPTRKTKEAAALYVEMISKKLVSPDKSGDDDVSSVDSFPELPNAKRNEQRESEIKAKALVNRRVEVKQQTEEKVKNCKGNTSKKTDSSKEEGKKTSSKNASQGFKKEPARHSGPSRGLSDKRTIRSAAKENVTDPELRNEPNSKNEMPILNLRPSTRSRHQEEAEVSLTGFQSKSYQKAAKTTLTAESSTESYIQNKKIGKGKRVIDTVTKKEKEENEKASKVVNYNFVQTEKAINEANNKISEKEILKLSEKKDFKDPKNSADKKDSRDLQKSSERKDSKNSQKSSERKDSKDSPKSAEKKGVKEEPSILDKKEATKLVGKKESKESQKSNEKTIGKELSKSFQKVNEKKDSQKTNTKKDSKELKNAGKNDNKETQKDGKESKSKKVTPASELKSKAKKFSEKQKPITDKQEQSVESRDNSLNRRPTRKCSAADKMCFEIEGFTSDEDDFFNTFKVTKARASMKRSSSSGNKGNVKTEMNKLNKNELATDVKNEKGMALGESKVQKEPKKNENKKLKIDSETHMEVVNEKISVNIETDSKKKEKDFQEKKVEEKNKSEEAKKDIDSSASKRAKISQEEELEGKVDNESAKLRQSPSKKPEKTIPKAAEDKRMKESFSDKEKNKGKVKEKVLKINKEPKEKQNPNSKETSDSKKVQKESEGLKEKVKQNKKGKSKVGKEKGSEQTIEEQQSGATTIRTRPIRQCSTGEKRWIETDSDSFSFYDTSDEESLPIFDFSSKGSVKSSLIEAKESIVSKEESVDIKALKSGQTESSNVKNNKKEAVEKVEEKKKEDTFSDNFSESDDEPLKKKAFVAKIPTDRTIEINVLAAGTGEVKSPKTPREVPGLHPLKKSPNELQQLASPTMLSPSRIDPLAASASVVSQSTQCSTLQKDANKISRKPELSIVQLPIQPKEGCAPDVRNYMLKEQKGSITSMQNRIEMILHSIKKDKLPEVSTSCTGNSNVKVTFGNIPYPPVPHSSQMNQLACNYQVKPIITFPQPREPISTHGLDLLSEVALPTTPKEKLSSQTERIEKWLKDSLAAEQKQSFPAYEGTEYKERERYSALEKPDAGSYLGKSYHSPMNVSSHSEMQKFTQVNLLASQNLLKKNVFAAESKPLIDSPKVAAETIKIESHPTPPKKPLTSVQDLLKLQKERKEMAKSPAENSPHLKNCKCNNCIVKKGWFKNKPVPKVQQQKLSPVEDSVKPFQSLAKAFTKTSLEDTEDISEQSSKMSVSVVPIVMTSSAPKTKLATNGSKDTPERKGIFRQRKLSFLERMRERERKEAAAAAANLNAFSPNNESSVYAFEPEPEPRKAVGLSSGFRSKTRDNRSSRTSKSDDDSLKLCEEEPLTVSSGTQVDKPVENKGAPKTMLSASIAVQVNLDSEAVADTEPGPEIQDSKSIEISTQTEVPEEDSDSPMFFIPLQKATTSGASDSSDQQLIQGVTLKLGTEGPMGPNQRVVMKAKLVTKPPDSPSIKAVVMPQPKRIFDQKINNPPIGTVHPTTRKPPEVEPKNEESQSEAEHSTKDVSQAVEEVTHSSAETTVEPESFAPSKTSTTSPGTKNKTKDHGGKEKSCPSQDENLPSTSVQSSAKLKRTSKQKCSESVASAIASTSSSAVSTSKMVEAPTFYATEKDFQDPFEFFDKIRQAAEKFGLCRIVPPSNFKPDCKVSDDMRFTAYNQYVHRMFHRWGPNVKEMMAIKKYLATQSISLKQPPWIGGIEVDLPRLYQCVQTCGGLMKVMEKKKWNQVADMLKIPKAAQDRVTKLDDIYCKYLLPYDTLSHDERQKLFVEVENDWSERQQSSNDASESQGEDEAEEENYIEECEECVVKGKNMALNQFYRIARNSMNMWFKNSEPSAREVENEFWKHVSDRNHHVCVHSGSIDSSGCGYGFPVAKNNLFSKHPWNLKVLTNNSGSVLRSLGPVMGVTVPTIHVGMVFTAFCWYRDPHGLPWIEYAHTGAPKIWYGISDDNSTVFQEALTKLLPRYIKNKTIWLPSDTAMIPPSLLVENGVSLCRTVQEPGQFILVFPRAFISSVCTGYLVSESVYFARPSWLMTAEQAFKDIQESCEPSMFSLEKLLFSIANDSRSNVEVLKQVLPMVWHVRQREIDGRKTLLNLGLKTSERLPSRDVGNKKRKGRWIQDDDGDYECEICRTNLYVSLVTNSQEEGTYCLPHAIDLLTQKRHQLKYCKLMYTYTQEEMNELIEKLEQKIESKSQKKTQNKSTTK